MRFIFLFLGSFCFSLSCKHLTAKEKLAGYINNYNNHIQYKESINGAELIVKYIPMEQEKIISKYPEPPPNNDDYLNNIYFDIKINKPGVKRDNARDLYINFDIQNDFQLNVNDELMSPAICQKIQNGIKDQYEYMVVFETPALEVSGAKSVELIYTDKVFSVGQRKYVFEKKDILKIPKLANK